jgi:fructan beta-fructosidase
MKYYTLALFLLSTFHGFAQTISLEITHRYLNLPVAQRSEKKKMTFDVGGKTDREFLIRLSDEAEYWTFCDMSGYLGQTLQIKYEGNVAGLSKIFQSDQPAQANTFYSETNRPQLHFTSRVGWLNDPNGLLFYDGEYHLFYQHNPYEREWGNMHWGHAVSSDLIHWKELPIALYPDRHGTMFSGSAVIDYENTSGFGSKANPAMVAIYTADSPEKQVQCLAYSLDKGRTWTKYEENPVIDSGAQWNTHDTRDPKVFWHAPIAKWVMVLNERDGHSIYHSANLKQWAYQSHTTGFWECPELFELPVDDDPNTTRWVMYGASGTYMIGQFDGREFTPLSGKHQYGNGVIYAAQTFSNIPASDGRRIQIGWNRIDNPGMPFKSQMGLPTELSLKTTPNGIRLFNNPVREVDRLQGAAFVNKQGLTAGEASKLLQPFNDAATLRVKATIKLSHATAAGLSLYGQPIVQYDLNHNLLNGAFYSPVVMTSMELKVDIILDKTSVEVFVDNGHYSYCIERRPKDGDTQGFVFSGKEIEVKNLEVYEMKSIWASR